jgi:hypothetical protein
VSKSESELGLAMRMECLKEWGSLSVTLLECSKALVKVSRTVMASVRAWQKEMGLAMFLASLASTQKDFPCR